MTGEFDGVPFAAGYMIGLRAFALRRASDGSAEICGITYRWPFRPGINQAMHLDVEDLPLPKGQLPDGHEVAQLHCSCGFWAYYNGTNNGSHFYNVAAVVEGFGRVTYGSEGFRCSKMRLLGLIREPYNDIRYSDCDCPSCNGETVEAEVFEEIAGRFDVPIYPNHAAAVHAHPLTAPPPMRPKAEPSPYRPPFIGSYDGFGVGTDGGFTFRAGDAT